MASGSWAEGGSRTPPEPIRTLRITAATRPPRTELSRTGPMFHRSASLADPMEHRAAYNRPGAPSDRLRRIPLATQGRGGPFSPWFAVERCRGLPSCLPAVVDRDRDREFQVSPLHWSFAKPDLPPNSQVKFGKPKQKGLRSGCHGPWRRWWRKGHAGVQVRQRGRGQAGHAAPSWPPERPPACPGVTAGLRGRRPAPASPGNGASRSLRITVPAIALVGSDPGVIPGPEPTRRASRVR
jgi:hypothetical protein